MKYVVFVPDGMAGQSLDELNDLTCMEAANAPVMDLIARKGIAGTVKNVPKGMTPASDVANLSILGYDSKKYYCGRGPLEAANLGVELGPLDVAFRFNMVTVSDDEMTDYSAGHITTNESAVLVNVLNGKLGSDRLKFFPGTSYRNLLVVKCSSREEAEKMSRIKCFPPHDIMGQSVSKHFPRSKELVELMGSSRELLQDNDINKVRIDLKQNPANMIWLWGQGMKPDMPLFTDAFGVTGGMISAVDLLKGIGKVIGLEVVEVPGATGYYDTDYDGKAEAAIELLSRKDLVFVHVEAPDEAGHNGDIREKIKAIENFDRKITKRIMGWLKEKHEYRVMILPDHPTPVTKRTHTSTPVPFAMMGSGIEPDEVIVFSERSAKAGSVHLDNGAELMGLLLKK